MTQNNFKSKKKFFCKKNSKYHDVRKKNSRELGVNTNSPQWYYPNPTIKSMATAMNFNIRSGSVINLEKEHALTYNDLFINRMPGVCTNIHVDIPGVSTDPTSPVNQEAFNIYTTIRKNVSLSTLPFEAPDLFNYLYAVGFAYAWITFMRRIYRTLCVYDRLNNYTPDALLYAMGVDTTDLSFKGENLKFYLDYQARRINKMYLPKGVAWVDKMIDTYQHIYIDEDIAKAQFILDVPGVVWQFQVDSTTSKGKVVALQSHLNVPGGNNFEWFRNMTESLINPIFNDEDFGTITGYLSRAFGDNHDPYNILEWDSSPIQFEYSKEYLEKWHNACVGGADFQFWSGFEITQETDSYLNPYIKFNPTYSPGSIPYVSSAMRSCGNRLLDFYDNQISEDQILTATRWMFTFKRLESGADFQFESVGTEFVPEMELIYFDKDNKLTFKRTYTTINVDINDKIDMNDFLSYSILTKWNYAPIVLVLRSEEQPSSLFAILGDFGNYKEVSGEELSKLHLCALEGLFNPDTL